MSMLENVFTEQIKLYNASSETPGLLWKDVLTAYSKSSRHYHNLHHLDNLLEELMPLKQEINDWTAVVLAIAYHDIVYNTLKKDNEEKSAAFAVEKLTMAGIPETVRQTCYQHIIATKTHQTSPRTDTNLFTDADLSILGAPPDVYAHYCRMIRKEYSYYPDLVYNPGRKKVLQHFLAMPAIYKTDHFAAKYEAQARRNMALELADMGR